MNKLANRIHDESNGLDYVLMGDYYIPDIQLAGKEQCPIGRWGRMHMEYLKEYRPVVYQELLLSSKLWSYLADLNEQAEEQLECIIQQMKEAEGVTEQLKANNQMQWVGMMNNIRNRAEENIVHNIVFCDGPKMQIATQKKKKEHIVNAMKREENRFLRRYERKHLKYLKVMRNSFYKKLLSTENLWKYLADVDFRAEKRKAELIQCFMAKNGITEQLKELNSVEWHNRVHKAYIDAEIIVSYEIIYR